MINVAIIGAGIGEKHLNGLELPDTFSVCYYAISMKPVAGAF